MVDATGKPFEVTVFSSGGDKAFEQASVQVIQKSTFEPASVNGKPVESGMEMLYKFMTDTNGATMAFRASYKSANASINSGDRTEAAGATAILKGSNLYEDSYVALAKYAYASKWGDDFVATRRSARRTRRQLSSEGRAPVSAVSAHEA